MPDDLKQKTISGVSWSFVEQVVVRGFNFVVGILLARMLDTSDYGLIGMLGIFIAVSQLFIDGGFANALIQTKDLTEKDISTVYLINLSLSVFFYIVLYGTAPLIASFYHQPILTSIMRYYALILVIGSVASVQGVILIRKVDFKTKSIISTGTAFASGIIALICAYSGMGVWALVIQSLASVTINTILTFVFVRWWPKLVFSIESFKKLFSFGSKLLAASLISTIYSNIYPLVIGKRFSASDTGLFSRASQFPDLCSTTIGGILNRVAFPVLSRIQDDDERLLDVYGKYIQLSSFLIFPLVLGLFGCARPLIHVLLTDKWIGCVPLMQIICFAVLFDGIILINLNLLYVKGRSDLVLKLEIIKKSIAFLILFITAFFGIKVMCYGKVLYSFIALYLNTIYTKKLLNYGLWDQMRTIFPYLLISLVILTESYAICTLIHNSWAALGLSFTVCPLTYFLLSYKADLYAFTELWSFVKERVLQIHTSKETRSSRNL